MLRVDRRDGDDRPTHLVATPTTTRTLCGRDRGEAFPHMWLTAALDQASIVGHDPLFCVRCVRAAGSSVS